MSDHVVKELVIVRHVTDDHGDGHHGGAWKIAFADFMTAMMAFFLVMWLINASNEATKKAVASYFNPIKLADVTSNPRGVQELRYGASSIDKTNTNESKPKEVPSDVKSDPGAPAVEVATALNDQAAGTAASVTGAGLLVPSPAVPAVDDEGLTVTTSGVPGAQPAKRVDQPGQAHPAPRDGVTAPAPNATMAQTSTAPSAQMPAAPPLAAQPQPAQAPAAQVQAGDQAGSGKAADAAQQDATAIGKAVSEALTANIGKIGPLLSVKVVPEGVLISLTDRDAFSMFQVGSAIPNTDMTDALKAVGRVLAHRQGSLIIRGHTDARRYHSDTYDNWRLSTDRAHVAFEYLVKGGVEETRIERIEGFADRSLLKADDPLAAENRRIEILIRNASR
jgi:chemotaxis protein MotB